MFKNCPSTYNKLKKVIFYHQFKGKKDGSHLKNMSVFPRTLLNWYLYKSKLLKIQSQNVTTLNSKNQNKLITKGNNQGENAWFNIYYIYNILIISEDNNNI